METLAERRFITKLMGSFGIVALLLSALGVYGVVMLGVVERRREIGIRLAIGALPGDVARGVLADTLRLTAIGVGVGLALVVPVTPLLANQLFGVGVPDPATLGGVPALVVALTTAAALLSAYRAMHADPMATIRGE